MAIMILRIAFGVTLAIIGLTHYMTLSMFISMTSSNLGPLTTLGTVWAYILPGLMIVGGILLAANIMPCLGTIAAGTALASIAIGMPLKAVIGGANLGDVMPAANNAFIWLLVYAMVTKCCVGKNNCRETMPKHTTSETCCGGGCQ